RRLILGPFHHAEQPAVPGGALLGEPADQGRHVEPEFLRPGVDRDRQGGPPGELRLARPGHGPPLPTPPDLVPRRLERPRGRRRQVPPAPFGFGQGPGAAALADWLPDDWWKRRQAVAAAGSPPATAPPVEPALT